jgi:hypothetical protein
MSVADLPRECSRESREASSCFSSYPPLTGGINAISTPGARANSRLASSSTKVWLTANRLAWIKLAKSGCVLTRDDLMTRVVRSSGREVSGSEKITRSLASPSRSPAKTLIWMVRCDSEGCMPLSVARPTPEGIGILDACYSRKSFPRDRSLLFGYLFLGVRIHNDPRLSNRSLLREHLYGNLA